jgi:hypothetical protein
MSAEARRRTPWACSSGAVAAWKVSRSSARRPSRAVPHQTGSGVREEKVSLSKV